MPAMEFRLLGPVGIFRHGTEVALDGAKQRTVVAALLLARGHAVSASRLCELLWGEDPPATYAAQIYNYVSRLRKYLGDDVEIVRRWTGYLLDLRDSHLDLDQFDRLARSARESLARQRHAEAARRLRAAVELWRGPALSNVTENLSRAESHRMTELRLAAVESLMSTELVLGRHIALVPELTRLVTEHPLHERLRSHLMTALLRCDRQGDALAVYHDGRRVLADELGVDPGPTLTRAYDEILAQPTARPAVREVAGWRDVRPAMLPPGLADFAGRDRELTDLTAFLARPDTHGPATAVVTGMAGVGKTALALRAAHLTRAAYPGGQLFADLGAARGTAVEPYDVLGWFLRSLGNDESAIPVGLERRASLYRSQVADRRVLVVLDDAGDFAHVRPLLPGDGAGRVLLTSRQHIPELAGPGVIELGPLTRTEALALLGSIIGEQRVAASPADANRIVALCGGLSLAIRIAGARLLARPHWTLAQLAQRLLDEGRRLDELRLGTWDVRGRIAGSYLAVPAQAQLALRRLSLLDLPTFPGGVAADVLGLPPGAGEEIAENLVDARLLEIAGPDQGLPRRHRFHELVRIFAREQVEPNDRAMMSGVGPYLRSGPVAAAVAGLVAP